MRFKTFLLFYALIFCAQISSAASNSLLADTLYADKLKPLGRTLINDQKQLELVSSAASFEFKFKGNKCEIYFSLKDKKAHNYIQYELDGSYQKRLRVEGNSNGPIVISTESSAAHTVRVFKTTEAHTGGILVLKIVASHVKPNKNANAPLIEFIGNSITCGAAADPSEIPCGTGEYHDQHNAYMAYGPRVARSLGLNYLLSSVSGIGIYRTWNMDGPAMPQVYENIDFKPDNTQMWDFSTYKPTIVSIALGTNDLSKGDGKTPRAAFDQKVFIESYLSFVKQIKSKYPKAKIALISSPMISGASGKVLEECLTSIKNQINLSYPSDKPVRTFYFTPIAAHGCGGHPSVEDHLILAQQLKPFYESMLK
ncbi:GDSL-type esterase/lipase family protein [Pedobacter sp. JCM 36344]|uniref:SGNH/GDSL hydrolase family protein n=1 Tax=Pedobacter sp. JCM 36344 TaxID=3374280 RepID=UPI00397A4D36